MRDALISQLEPAEDQRIDMNSNDLHAAESPLCPVCGKPIAESQPVRKRVDGSYQHDAC